jgi:hypothetical protein
MPKCKNGKVVQPFLFSDLSLKSDTKENFGNRFPILEWTKLLKCSHILRWYRYISRILYLFWMNNCCFIYLQHGLSKFMDVNSSITPLEIATSVA